MINVQADLSGLGKYIGDVGGILEAVQSPQFQDDFTSFTMKHLRKKFIADTIAAHSNPKLQHVFEWGDSKGGTSAVPLFKVNITGKANAKILNYTFLPSTKPVPVDPAIDFPTKEHIFVMKALVMETQSKVTIKAKWNKSGRLIVAPSNKSKKGYVMVTGSVDVNPGGKQATGGFASWWTAWFESAGKEHILESTRLASEVIQKTGQKIIRNSKGQFAVGKTINIAYINAEKRASKMEMRAAMREVLKNEERNDMGLEDEE